MSNRFMEIPPIKESIEIDLSALFGNLCSVPRYDEGGEQGQGKGRGKEHGEGDQLPK